MEDRYDLMLFLAMFTFVVLVAFSFLWTSPVNDRENEIHKYINKCARSCFPLKLTVKSGWSIRMSTILS
jgi:hypothetical protein